MPRRAVADPAMLSAHMLDDETGNCIACGATKEWIAQTWCLCEPDGREHPRLPTKFDERPPMPISLVRASATVERIMGCSPKIWSVTVTGLAPHAETRTYTLNSPSDNAAAQAGIARFVEEMESRQEQG